MSTLLELPLFFSEPDVLPAIQPIMSQQYRKTQWLGRLFRHGISTPSLTMCRNITVDHGPWSTVLMYCITSVVIQIIDCSYDDKVQDTLHM